MYWKLDHSTFITANEVILAYVRAYLVILIFRNIHIFLVVLSLLNREFSVVFNDKGFKSMAKYTAGINNSLPTASVAQDLAQSEYASSG